MVWFDLYLLYYCLCLWSVHPHTHTQTESFINRMIVPQSISSIQFSSLASVALSSMVYVFTWFSPSRNFRLLFFSFISRIKLSMVFVCVCVYYSTYTQSMFAFRFHCVLLAEIELWIENEKIVFCFVFFSVGRFSDLFSCYLFRIGKRLQIKYNIQMHQNVYLKRLTSLWWYLLYQISTFANWHKWQNKYYGEKKGKTNSRTQTHGYQLWIPQFRNSTKFQNEKEIANT